MKIVFSILAMTVLAVVASVDTAPAQIYPYSYPWCASFNGGGGRDSDNGGENCGFKTYDQCLQFVQPFGMCRNNPWYRPTGAETQSTPRRKQRGM
jgi:hypothetical protein